MLSLITRNDASQSVGLLWTRDRPLADTFTWQHATLITNNHAPDGNRTRNPNNRAAEDLRLRHHVNWDRQFGR